MALTAAVAAVSLSACAGSSVSDFPIASLPTAPQTAGDGDAVSAAAKQAGAVRPQAGPATKIEAAKQETAKVQKVAADGAGLSAVKAAEELSAAGTPGSAAYKIGPQDVLELSVFKVPELAKMVQVAESGTANFPLVGEVPAAGKTAQEVERDVTKRLGAKYLQNPQVTVFVKEYNSQRVTVEGAVKKPGVYPIRGRSTLLQFIAIAEGSDPNAGSEVLVFRQTNGKRAAAKFDIDEIRSGKVDDPPLQSGDVIVVPTSATKEAFNNFVKVSPALNIFRVF